MEIGALLVKTNPVLEAFETNRNPNLSPSPIPSSNPITQVLEAFGNAVTTLNKVDYV
jgi:myosin heavy subunit